MTPDRIVFLFDVDNTLLDNDQVSADLRAYLLKHFGEAACAEYWQVFEELRGELGYADYLGALQRYRVRHLREPGLLRMSQYLIDYPFAERLYPGALEVVRYVRQVGPAVILSDGDVVFQPRKVRQSGLGAAFEDRVLIYVHKEQELEDVEQRFPAAHYVLVDDKLRILDAVKRTWGSRVTTVFPRQGHYAVDPKVLATYPSADVTIERIGELLQYDVATLRSWAGRD